MNPPLSLPPNLATQPPLSKSSNIAATQVSSAEILADAHDIKQTDFRKPDLNIQDLDELRLFQLAKRRDYEQQLNKNRLNYGQWMRYAKWEIEFSHDLKRARSIMERALEVNVQHVPFWVRYIELELLHKNVNHARNLLDRAVTILPRTDKFWFMYVQTEETLGNFAGVRLVFERWLQWHPSELAWDSYVLFEERYGEVENARAVLLRYVVEFPTGDTWKRWLLLETMLPVVDDMQVAKTRGVFEAALDTLLASGKSGADRSIPGIVLLWVDWETSVGEAERARAILATALDSDLLLKEQKLEVLRTSAHSSGVAASLGSPGSSGAALPLKNRLRLEKAVMENPRDYDSWWEYAKLQELALGARHVMDILSKAVEHCPLDELKLTTWRRYVYLWIKLALYHEYVAKDIPGAREAWRRSLQTVPHGKFTFAKLWAMSAEFELRNGGGLAKARKILGLAIGQSCKERPKRKLFKYYVELEKRLGELERVRRVYEKWLESSLVCDRQTGEAQSVAVLQQYIDFEKSVGESGRCVALFDIGISGEFPPSGVFFDAYIDFLKDEFRYDKAREVYRARLGSAGSWIQLALFESSILSPEQMDELERADSDEVRFEVGEHHLRSTRAIFSEAYAQFRDAQDGANATHIVEAWLEYENMHGSREQAEQVRAKAPKQITKRRGSGGVEEIYHEYDFPESAPNLSRFLAKAKQWASTTTG
ncbi:hypothetical protein METBIDRAFT_32908 [Metschnikowia bicuspidata var. bicuspidata NRRL YB-4993]|uniref:Pre-mRNA-splicing factor CLF1 n=1 Tax=Metschnikowia bicuspidata var. bicuspidata NRRL YB-4993 TaxID=869754 RepID=A0A1A0H7I5_9ASCO|nr:hypothetical protein METBIDRAFT_32908 [Metschnikowia bicuspidata var. bicuspidata NRRL YB-4993]OBA19863.1 hypothetical protein METBIDRAFT_32908 [Metschnikowia bicuspidata var. bicuspidata NRRL YB-4993]